MSEPMTGNREFRDDIVRVATLTVTAPSIEGYTFVNCQIIGPAVLALVDSVTMNNCVYEADINSLFWEVDPVTRPVVFGAVGVFRCAFYSCSFQAIGFAGTPELREQMEAAVINP